MQSQYNSLYNIFYNEPNSDEKETVEKMLLMIHMYDTQLKEKILKSYFNCIKEKNKN